MFYILNFASHDFLSCSNINQAVIAIANILQTGLGKDDIEIVNCFSDDVRLSVDGFFKMAKEEERK